MAGSGMASNIPRLNFSFSRGVAAAELWRFGEDELAAATLTMSDDQLQAAWSAAADCAAPDAALPVEARAVTNGHVMCFGCMQALDGEIRPLARTEPRPADDLPASIQDEIDDPSPTPKPTYLLGEP